MTPALYEVQFSPDQAEWSVLGTWQVPPPMLSRFLDHIFRVLNSSGDAESKAMLRVKRVQWGVAEYEFGYFEPYGYGHVACQH